jgi:iron complex transport system permease protein
VPLSMMLAAILLLVADVLGRVVTSGAEVQAGVMMAILGAPAFIVLVRRRRLVAL